jgi:hypothetical protein
MKSTLRQFLAELQSYADENPEMLDKPIQIRIEDYIDWTQSINRSTLLATFEAGSSIERIYSDDSKEKTKIWFENDGSEN